MVRSQTRLSGINIYTPYCGVFSRNGESMSLPFFQEPLVSISAQVVTKDFFIRDWFERECALERTTLSSRTHIFVRTIISNEHVQPNFYL